jgi:hypothetical protein
MRARRPFVLTVVLMTAAMAGCLGGTQDASQGGSDAAEASDSLGAIEGRVVDDEWMPLKGADVTLLEAPASVKTDADGAFVFNDLEPRSYSLAALKIGYFQKTVQLDVAAGKVLEVDLILDRVPVADPPFDEATLFHGNVTAGTAAGGPEPVVGEPVDAAEFTLTIPERKKDGTLLAAVFTQVELVPMEGPGTIDLDLYLLSPTGDVLGSSTSGGPHEVIQYDDILPAGDYTLRVYFWLGAAAEFDLTATVTYEQGEAAEYAIKKG